MTQREMLAIVRLARKNEGKWMPLGNGWSVKAERVYNMARGGPMSAWKYIYYLLSPEGKAPLGGYDRADSFVAWAQGKMKHEVIVLCEHSIAHNHPDPEDRYNKCPACEARVEAVKGKL